MTIKLSFGSQQWMKLKMHWPASTEAAVLSWHRWHCSKPMSKLYKTGQRRIKRSYIPLQASYQEVVSDVISS
jgi:hypothetical protein